MAGQRLAAVGLLGAAATGGLAALRAPRRFGRRGRLAVTTGAAILLLRDVSMVANGVPDRLKRLPRVLLYFELACAAAASVLGIAATVRASRPAAEDGQPTRARGVHLGVMADSASTLTFVLHVFRQAIYIAPGQGRLEPQSGETAMGLGEPR